MKYRVIYDEIKEEIKLRAKNNYGNWSNREQLASHVKDAIQDIFNDISFDFNSNEAYHIVEEIEDEDK